MDLESLACHLRAALPATTIRTPLAVLGEGFGSLVVETADGIVFRIAKHAEAGREHQRERFVLPVIRRTGSSPRVPEIRYVLDASSAFPFGAIGYEKLPGRPLASSDIDEDTSTRIAEQIAGFLIALHSIDLGNLRDLDLPEFPPPRKRLTTLWQNISTYLEQHLNRSDHLLVHRWLAGLHAYGQRYAYAPTLVHGDLWYENLLYDEEHRRLVGVIDFGNLALGDPAIDLATQHYLGDRFAHAVTDAYYRGHIPPDSPERIETLLALRELLGLELGVTTGNVDADAMTKVQEAILTAHR